MEGNRGNLRPGLSLLEVIITIAILGVMLAMLLVAIQKSRESATRLQSLNNIRQISLGVHGLVEQRLGEIKPLPATPRPEDNIYRHQTLFWHILPWTHQAPTAPGKNATADQIKNFFKPVVKVYLSPGDPTLQHPLVDRFPCARVSYTFNMQAIDGGLSVPFSLPDGTSQTIMVCENYFAQYTENMDAAYILRDFTYVASPAGPDDVNGIRRATFADAAWGDVYPVTDTNTNVSRASVPGLTFQIRPPINQVNPYIPASPFNAGLPLAMFDGSVRILSPNIDEAVFWSLVTPNGQEVVGDF